MAKGLIRSLGRANPGAEKDVRRVVYPVSNVSLTVTAGASTNKGLGSAVIGKLPEGNVLYLGGVSYLQFVTTSVNAITTWAGNYSVGTAINAAQSLTTTSVNLIDVATITAATAKLSPVIRGISPVTLAAPVLDNQANSLNLNLNMLTNDDSVTDSLTAAFTVNGYVTLVYIVLGDS